MTSFALMVLGNPLSSQSPATAFAFATAAIASGHRILRVFFFHDGVLCGNSAAAAPTGAVAEQWRQLATAHDIDLVLCVTSAIKRGVLDEPQARRLQLPATTAAPFALAGLGQWVEACVLADRVVTFGP